MKIKNMILRKMTPCSAVYRDQCFFFYPCFTCICDNQEVLDRWKQYFAALMKMDKKIADQTQDESFEENEIDIEQQTYKEVRDTTIKLKENKTPGIVPYTGGTNQVYRIHTKT